MKRILLTLLAFASLTFAQSISFTIPASASLEPPLGGLYMGGDQYQMRGIATPGAGATTTSVSIELDGSPCGGRCVSVGTTPPAWQFQFDATIGASALPGTAHTLRALMTDSLGGTAQTSLYNVFFVVSSAACSATTVTSGVTCREQVTGGQTSGTLGPTASVTQTGNSGTDSFLSGDTMLAVAVFQRPASPYLLGGPSANFTAAATTITPFGEASYTSYTANTTLGTAVVTLSSTNFVSLGQCGRSGQIISGTAFSPGTVILNCDPLNILTGGSMSNQAQITVYPPPIATDPANAVTIGYQWPSPTSVGLVSVGSSGGSGYKVGDIVSISGGNGLAEALVTSVSSGSITGVMRTATSPAKFYLASTYSDASNVSTTAVVGTGSGATLNIKAGFIVTITDQGYGPGYEKFLVTACGSPGCNGGAWTIVRGVLGASILGTYGIAHDHGQFLAVDPGPYPAIPSYVTDTAGNTWSFTNCGGTEYTDQNTVGGCLLNTKFTPTTAATAQAGTGCSMAPCDKITLTAPYSFFAQVTLNTIRYRGLGAISAINQGLATGGWAAVDHFENLSYNAAMTASINTPSVPRQSWPAVTGDVCIAELGGSPFMPVIGGTNTVLYPLGGSGFVTTSGHTVTYSSGTVFNTSYDPNVTPSIATPWQPGAIITLNGADIHIAAVVDSMHITTIEALSTVVTPETYLVPDGGSPPNPSTGWAVRSTGNRTFIIDNVAGSGGCNGGAFVSNGDDGVGSNGISFTPLGAPTTVYGQSALITSTNSLANTSIPAISLSTGKGSVDFEIDNLSAASNDSNFIALNNLGFSLGIVQLGGGVYQISGSNSHFITWDGKGDSATTCQGNPYQFIVSNIASVSGNKPVYGRYQVDFGAKNDKFELWDGTGVRIYALYCGWKTVTGSLTNGITIGPLNSTDTLNIGFLWQRLTILPLNSKMPTFAHTGSPNCVYDYHFDTTPGNTTDSCAGTYSLTVSSGIVTYPNTPSAIQQLIKAVPTQLGGDLDGNPISTSISGWKVMNSSGSGSQQMDCLAQSIIQYNGSDIPLSCAWTQTQGPALTGMPSSLTQPTISGIVPTNLSSTITQDYILSATVPDLESPPGTASTGTIEMGAAPLDANGVIQNITGNTAQVFTPLIGYGYHPWGETDTVQYYMIGAQQAFQAANNQYLQWLTYPSATAGRVTYPFRAKGQGSGPSGTTLATAVLSTDNTIQISDITKISSTFPTWIMIGTLGSNYELVRITGCVSTCPGSGSATLQVAYDGRGLSPNTSATALGAGIPTPASAWSMGATVGEMRIQGNGSTLFVTDTLRPIAQAGAPGPEGLNVTSPGTIVSLAAGTTTIVGSGTSWTSAIVGQSILMIGVGSTSGAFNLWRQVTGFTNATHITVDHATPTGMTTYSGAYQLVSSNLYISLELPAPQDDHTIRLFQPIFGCESETACFGLGGHDLPPIDTATISNQKYSWQTATGSCSTQFTGNFYGTGLAARNLYLRSGYYPALQLANSIDDNCVRSPEMGDGYVGGPPLNYGGGVNGAIADFVSNPSTTLTSSTLEQFGINNVFSSFGGGLLQPTDMTPQSCNVDDSRDTGIIGGFVSALANWDINTGSTTLTSNALSTDTVLHVGSTAGFPAPPFLALIGLAGSDSTYEFIRVTSITSNTITFSGSPYYPSGSAVAHTSPAPIYAGAAMYTFLLTKTDVRDLKCRRNVSDGYNAGGLAPYEPNSFADASQFANNQGPLSLTSGLSTGTSSGPLPTCNGQETGTIYINTGSDPTGFTATLTGSSIVGGPPSTAPSHQRIYIWDGTTLTAFAYISNSYGTTGATVTLTGSGTVGGLTCTTSGSPCTYMTANSGNFTAIWNSNTDSYADNEALKKNWECVLTGGSGFTLNRPWDGPTNTNYYAFTSALSGFKQQGYMVGGYKENGMRWAQHSSNSMVAADYLTMSQQVGTWYNTYGWDPVNSKGTFYGSVTQVCNPVTMPFNASLINSTLVSTLHGGDAGNVQGCGATGIANGSTQPNGGATGIARSQNPEGGGAMIQWYNLSPAANKSTVDAYMGAISGTQQIYGANAGCAASVASTCDEIDASNCEIASMNFYKWPGFCGGQGGFFTTSWPAVRTMDLPQFSPVQIGGKGIMGKGIFLIDPDRHRWLDW